VDAIRLGSFRLNRSGFAVPYPPPLRRWTERALRTGLPHWPAIALAFATLAVLLVFCHVLREAVHRGQVRQAADALHHRETWRCNALLGVSARQSCLLQLNTPSDDALAAGESATPSRPVGALALATAPTH
jgi:hypothetical protein